MTNASSFDLEQIALRDALQQTTALRLSGAPSSTTLGQQNTLESALQRTSAVQAAYRTQNGVLTLTQLQTLTDVQASLMGLLISQPPPLANRRPGP
jgi:hypothetical protein